MTTESVTDGGVPEFADVPAGTLPGGTPTPGFRLAVVPTTVAQYWSYIVDQNLRRMAAPSLHGFPREGGTGLRLDPDGAVVREPELVDLPVTAVTWKGAQAYAEWLGRRLGAPCRLPTAAEWHYAAAGPNGFRWSLGNEFDRDTYAPPAHRPRVVGRTPANAFGLHDMTGNVFEWCADALTVPGAPDGPALVSRVLKGGAYIVRNPESFENATAFTADELSAVPYIGFRVLCDTSGIGPGAVV